MAGRYSVLACGLVAVLLVHPLIAAREAWTSAVFGAALAAILPVALVSIAARRWVWSAAAGLSLAAVAATIVALAGDWRPAAGFAMLGYGGAFAVLTASVVADIARPGRVSGQRIWGAVSAYLLMGMTWAFGYAALEIAVPGSFDLSAMTAARDHSIATAGQFFYFSFVTLTTLGYGDVSPIEPLARALTAFEAVAGQLFLAVLVARLVGLHVGAEPTAEKQS